MNGWISRYTYGDAVTQRQNLKILSTESCLAFLEGGRGSREHRDRGAEGEDVLDEAHLDLSIWAV